MPLIQWIIQNLAMGTPNFTGDGGIIFDGAAVTTVSLFYEGSGTIIFNSEAIITAELTYTGSGEIVFSGTSPSQITNFNYNVKKFKFLETEIFYDENMRPWQVEEVQFHEREGTCYIGKNGSERRSFRQDKTYDISEIKNIRLSQLLQDCEKIKERIEDLEALLPPSC